MDIGSIFSFISHDRFDILDLVIFYFIWTELLPWLERKWKEHRGFAWKCPYCKGKKAQFRISNNYDKEIVSHIALDHVMKFHMKERRKDEPVTDQ